MLNSPVIAVRFTLASGEVLEREWAISDPQPRWLAPGPPAWLLDPKKSWPHPQDPILFTGRVAEGHEDEVRRLLDEGRR